MDYSGSDKFALEAFSLAFCYPANLSIQTDTTGGEGKTIPGLLQAQGAGKTPYKDQRDQGSIPENVREKVTEKNGGSTHDNSRH